VYAVVDVSGFSPDVPRERNEREARTAAERQRVAALLRRLAKAEPGDTAFDAESRRVRAMFGDENPREALLRAADRIRVQSGLRESFRDGLVRSGRYLGAVRRVFAEHGLPAELAYLAHVESSYNPAAVSKAGAVGVWQFTKDTGRLFLRVDDAIDERRDPLLSTVAAARLLKRNHEATGRWPLAVTAYNHGLRSIRNAMETHGTDDLEHLLQAYENQSFGFASKNFYAEFLAAVRVASRPAEYFGDLVPDPPFDPLEVELPVPLRLDALARAFRADPDTLAALNPAFRRPVLDGGKPVPRGYPLRLPADADEAAAYQTLTSEGFLPRGAARAWCRGAERELFRPGAAAGKGGAHVREPAS
jgi:membrane-bound lytic murein transglycosylase D